MYKAYRPDEMNVLPYRGMMPVLCLRGTGIGLLRLVLALIASVVMLYAQLPDSSLSIQLAKDKIVWWRSAEAPKEWTKSNPIILKAVHWNVLRPGLESARLDLWGDHVGLHVAVILARLDPEKFTLRLDMATNNSRPAWDIDSASTNAALAVNVGQFEGDRPWGWLIQEGKELQPPRSGPLSSALVVDSEGRVSIIDADEIPGVRKQPGIRIAFQSYPAILTSNGRVPAPLRAPGRGVDLEHRDSRLALGLLPDGHLLFALTRFAGTGSILSQLPMGPTTAEMAAIMGALGCQRALLLDGGLSGQLLVRDARNKKNRWPGLRAVPLGLTAVSKK
jgi:hypothetical protein